MGLQSLPAESLPVARYLAVRAGDGATIATLRLVTSAIAKAHELAGHDSPGKDRGVRESLKGWGRRLARPQRQAGTLTADVLSVIRFTAPRPSRRGRGFETAEQAAERARFDLALVAVLSDAGLRRSEASSPRPMWRPMWRPRAPWLPSPPTHAGLGRQRLCRRVGPAQLLQELAGQVLGVIELVELVGRGHNPMRKSRSE